MSSFGHYLGGSRIGERIKISNFVVFCLFTVSHLHLLCLLMLPVKHQEIAFAGNFATTRKRRGTSASINQIKKKTIQPSIKFRWQSNCIVIVVIYKTKVNNVLAPIPNLFYFPQRKHHLSSWESEIFLEFEILDTICLPPLDCRIAFIWFECTVNSQLKYLHLLQRLR